MQRSTYKNELNCGRYTVVDTKPTIIGSLGRISKPGANAVRLLRDCSHPVGGNIHSYATLDSFKICNNRWCHKADPAEWLLVEDGPEVSIRKCGDPPGLLCCNWLAVDTHWQLPETFLADSRLPFDGSRRLWNLPTPVKCSGIHSDTLRFHCR